MHVSSFNEVMVTHRNMVQCNENVITYAMTVE